MLLADVFYRLGNGTERCATLLRGIESTEQWKVQLTSADKRRKAQECEDAEPHLEELPDGQVAVTEVLRSNNDLIENEKTQER